MAPSNPSVQCLKEETVLAQDQPFTSVEHRNLAEASGGFLISDWKFVGCRPSFSTVGRTDHSCFHANGTTVLRVPECKVPESDGLTRVEDNLPISAVITGQENNAPAPTLTDDPCSAPTAAPPPPATGIA